MTDFLIHRDTLHQPGCPDLEGVDAQPATPTDHEHVDRCRRCGDGTTRYDGRETRDIRNDEHLMTDGGVEIEPTDTVWIPNNRHGGTYEVFHTDPECSRLLDADVREKQRRHVAQRLRVCRECAGTAEYGRAPDRSINNALQDAEPGDLMTDGGVELRDGETRDDSHARRNAETLASLRQTAFAALPESEQAILELLVAAGGQLRAFEVKSLAAAQTEVTEDGIQSAADRLVEKDLLAREPIPTTPRQTRWVLTDDGRAWVRAGGDE